MANLKKCEKDKEYFQEGYLEELDKREKAEGKSSWYYILTVDKLQKLLIFSIYCQCWLLLITVELSIFCGFYIYWVEQYSFVPIF